MLSLAKAGKDYYLQKLGQISPREDYYLRGGTATGVWRGGGAAETGLDGVVSAEGLVRLFDGLHPATGEQLGRKLRKDGVAAWDLTFSADKSVSLLWALGDSDTRQEVMAAFSAATEAALGYLESVASSTRGAERHPVLDEDGEPVFGEGGKPKMRVETWPIRTHGYVAASFTEFTSRENDPQLHTHVVVANKVKGVDGKWRALDGQLVYRHKLDAGYLHEAVLRHELTERLGVRWQPVRNGVADIEGFTRAEIEEFSRRRQQIEAWIEAEGLTPSAAAYEAATLATRVAKADHSVDELLAKWQERARRVGLTAERIAAVIGRDQEALALDVDALFVDLAAPDGLTASASTFSRGDVIRSVAGGLPEGGTREQVEDLAQQFLGTSDVVPILPKHSGRPRLPDIPGLTDDERQILEQRIAPHGGTPGLRRRDGTLHPGLVHERRYTTAELLATEQATITAAIDGVDTGRFTPPRHLVDAAISRRPHLTDGQIQAVRHLAGSGDAIDVAIGVAGSGKTTVMAAIRELAEATGTPIVGTALSGRAAAELETDSGITSFTITRLLGETQRDGGLAPGTLLVVDEAGMVGTRDLARLARLTEAAEGKLILTGDDHQLAEIEAGGMFTALANRLPGAQLTANIRQTEEWECNTLAHLRHGSIKYAVAEYRRHGRVVIEPTPADTLDRAVDDWHTYVATTGDISGVLLIAHHNATVTELNRRARTAMADSGRLHGPAVEADGRTYKVGDRIVFLKNNSRLGVLNGDLGTVTATKPANRTLDVRVDRRSDPIRIPAWYLEAGHVDYGYAITGHKAQGATVNRAFVVASDTITREWGYVALSRGRQANTIYIANPPVDDNCEHLHHPTEHHDQLTDVLARTDAQVAAIDTGRGPLTLTDEQLQRRLDEISPDTDARTDNTRAGSCDTDRLVAYATLAAERESRRRDHLAEVAHRPPGWLTASLGEQPATPQQRTAWTRIASIALDYRQRHGIADHEPGLLGDRPTDAVGVIDWIATRRTIDRHRADRAPYRITSAAREL